MPLGVFQKWLVVEIVTNRAGIREMINIVHSAELDPFGKPHPLPYLNCVKAIVDICTVFEDSVTGALSGKAAGMEVIVVPKNKNYVEHKFSF